MDAAAEKAGSKVGMTFASGWYNASFFLGAGFSANMNEDGTSADGFTGVDLAKAMAAIAANPGFLAVADGDLSNQIASGSVCAVISGTWDASACQTVFGEGYAATKLPTFTCAGKLARVAIVGAAALWCALLRTDFGFGMVLLTAAYQLFYDNRQRKLTLGCVISILYVTAPLSTCAISKYEGERGNIRRPLAWYCLYPLHLCILAVIVRFLR